MPQKKAKNESEHEKPACPVCGTVLLKSGYCPKCHRKKDGSQGNANGRPPRKDEQEQNDEETPSGGVTVQDYSRPPTSSDEDYLCEGCRAKVHYLQRKCRKCGIYLDWRGTEAETDEETVVCPECGAFCGYTEDNPAVCPHCGFAG